MQVTNNLQIPVEVLLNNSVPSGKNRFTKMNPLSLVDEDEDEESWNKARSNLTQPQANFDFCMVIKPE